MSGIIWQFVKFSLRNLILVNNNVQIIWSKLFGLRPLESQGSAEVTQKSQEL